MGKQTILYYTDCFTFGGCEKPIYNVFLSEQFRERYKAKLIYRKSTEYDSGMLKNYPQAADLERIAVKFPDPTTIAYSIFGKKRDGVLARIVVTIMKIFMKLVAIPVLIYEIYVLTRIFRRQSAEIVHINNGGYPAALSCQAAAIAAKISGKRSIIMNVNNLARPRWSIIEKMIDHFVGLSIDWFITGSQASAKVLSKQRGFDMKKIRKIYHGIDVVFIKYDSKVYQPSICMVARLEKRKGHKYVIQAFAELLNEDPNIRKVQLYVIGEGPISYALKKMVLANNTQDNVFFMGHRNDYLNFVANSLFLLNPSLGQEDLPLIILEAMGLGKPVIGTPVAGIPEEIQDQETGILVEPGNVGQLKAAMFKLIKDGQLRDQMGAKAKERYEALFRSKIMIEGYLALYDEVK